jgi:integrase
MIEAWDLRSRPGLQAILEGLQHDRTTPEWTLEDLRTWLLDDQEKAPTTVEDRLRHLRFMESYSPQPVKLLGTRYQFVLSGRLYYHVRKQTGSGPGALQKDLKCLRTLGRFLGVPKEVWPVMPPSQQRSNERIPTPEEVHELLHDHYAPGWPRNPVDAWARYVLAMHFGFGLRSPKEVWYLKARDFDPDTGLLRVTEPKKRHKVRQVYVEPEWLAKGRQTLSLENWLHWRAKLEPEGEAMFPNPRTGKEFASPQAFKVCLDRLVKPKHPWFHGYLARHWCCYARIIDSGFSDEAYNQVAEWFGHENVDMTRNVYGPGARAYSKSPAYGTNWMSRAFRKPRRSD